MTEQELRAKVIAQAKSWLGRKEADGSHKAIIDIYNQIRPLPRGYKMSYADPWCAAFVSAVGAACGLTKIILPECSCDYMIAAYKAQGRWFENDRTVEIRPGDLIFYDWNKDKSADHVGIVTDIVPTGCRVIEGNLSDAVGCRTVRRGYDLVRGFALPRYSDEAADDNLVTEPVKDEARFSLQFRVLENGCKGEDVRAVQRTLRALGFDIGRWGLDGDFGNDTKQAVMKYQRSVGLDADGAAGPATMAALNGLN